tara:strand:- start:4800 stop:5462 length:663 start_codon:yes stop_codon:yes gene_type:complete
MPNWCHNTLTIFCKNTNETKGFIKKLLKASADGEFNKFLIPYEEMGNKEWNYSSCIDHWGTKWDVKPDIADEEISDSKISISMSYDTAWSPNTPVLEKLYENLSNFDEDAIVECIYEEPGMGFCGRFLNGSDEGFELGLAHQLLNEHIEEISLINSEKKIKLVSDESIFFIEKSKEDIGEYSPIHDEHIQYEIIKCFSNYYKWGDGEVTLIKWDDDYFIL